MPISYAKHSNVNEIFKHVFLSPLAKTKQLILQLNIVSRGKNFDDVNDFDNF